MVLNSILAKVGDFLGRKFKLIASKFDEIVNVIIPKAKTEAVTEAKKYTDDKCAVVLNEAKAYTNTQINNLVNGAPEALDTLNGIGTYEEFVAAFNEQVGKDSIFYEKV